MTKGSKNPNAKLDKESFKYTISVFSYTAQKAVTKYK